MSENTTKGIEMDKERIAELREEIARNKATGYHDEGIGTFDSPTMEAAIDALEAAQAELATAREVIEESMEARRVTEAEGGALNQLNNEIDRLRAELAALRGQRQESEVAFGEWFETHFADWLRAMRGGFRHDDVRQFRDSLLTAWSAALRGQVGGVVPELTEALLDEIAGPWLPDRDPMCTRRAERRVGVRDAWAKIRALGVEVQRPGWSILSEETHELRSYTWRDDHGRLIEGYGLYAVGASEGSVPFQRYRARPSSRVAGEGQALVDGAELAALRNLFAACGQTIHERSGGCLVTLERINDAWAGVCAAQVLRATNGKGEATPATPDPAP